MLFEAAMLRNKQVKESDKQQVGRLSALCLSTPRYKNRKPPENQGVSVAPTGLEPVSIVPETIILSLELRSRKLTHTPHTETHTLVAPPGLEPEFKV